MVFTKPNVDGAICYKIIMCNNPHCVRLRIEVCIVTWTTCGNLLKKKRVEIRNWGQTPFLFNFKTKGNKQICDITLSLSLLSFLLDVLHFIFISFVLKGAQPQYSPLPHPPLKSYPKSQTIKTAVTFFYISLSNLNIDVS